jgi:hypothetical protein
VTGERPPGFGLVVLIHGGGDRGGRGRAGGETGVVHFRRTGPGEGSDGWHGGGGDRAPARVGVAQPLTFWGRGSSSKR